MVKCCEEWERAGKHGPEAAQKAEDAIVRAVRLFLPISHQLMALKAQEGDHLQKYV